MHLQEDGQINRREQPIKTNKKKSKNTRSTARGQSSRISFAARWSVAYCNNHAATYFTPTTPLPLHSFLILFLAFKRLVHLVLLEGQLQFLGWQSLN